jgi:AGZA family xanthine/uracil permease-like MFS transporter
MLEKLFSIKELGSSFKIELLGGFSTFMTMSYIIFVNAVILSGAGLDKAGIITITCLVCFLCSLISAVWSNSPICFAPGMGLNSIFVTSLVLVSGFSAFGALGIVFLASVLFLLLAVSGWCKKIIDEIPDMLKASISIGIGLFIAYIGFEALGGKAFMQGESINPLICSLTGLFTIMVLDKLKVRGSVLFGIIFASVLSVLLGETTLPESYLSFPPPSIDNLFLKLDLSSAFNSKAIAAIVSLAIVEVLGITGTIISCSSASGRTLVQNEKKIFIIDAISGIIGACFGTSTMTGYIESAVGIKEGARTGLAAAFCGLLFLLFLFFIPLIQSVPEYATAPALIMVGFMMMKDIKYIKLKEYKNSIPALLTIITMPLTLNIGVGMSVGFISYILINIFTKTKVSIVLWSVGILSLFNLAMFTG